MIEKQLQRIRAGFQRRREAISEISFTYTRLHGLLPTLMRRLDAPLAEMLERHRQADHAIHEGLVRIALEHGQPPVPTTCTAANALVEEVQYALRGTRRGNVADGLLPALKDLRLFLIRAWGRLIQELNEEDLPEFRREAIALQGREAEKHRDLVQLLPRLDDPDLSWIMQA
ncbi:MAG TPA: hypothetical protein VHL57_05695 [Flavobacteriales bacterium]|jgi:hypothetical protein|nr:hypothetical protein [Flavobacteriales bacterium]